MPKFPKDAPIEKVIKSFESPGFQLVREGNHVAMARENPDGTRTPLTMPNHQRIHFAYYSHTSWNIKKRVHESLL